MARSVVNERSAVIVDGGTVGVFMCRGRLHQRNMVLLLMMKDNMFGIVMAANVSEAVHLNQGVKVILESTESHLVSFFQCSISIQLYLFV